MPYDEIAYQKIEEEEGEKNPEGDNEKIRKLLRNETFEMCVCISLGLLVLVFSFHFGVNL